MTTRIRVSLVVEKRGPNRKVKNLFRTEVIWTPEVDGQLMELMSENLSIRAAARRMGISHNAASGRFTRLRREMGWQAV